MPDGKESLTEYRLKHIEDELKDGAVFRKEVRDTLSEIKTAVEVQRAKTGFLGMAAGGIASLPAIFIAWFRDGSNA